MNPNSLIVACASIVVVLTVTSYGVAGDGNCGVDNASQDVTIEKLSIVSMWHVQTSYGHLVPPCSELMVNFTVDNDKDGYVNLISIPRNKKWQAISAIINLRYSAPGQYILSNPEVTSESNVSAEEETEKLIFTYYDGAGLAMILCSPSYSKAGVQYFTATAERTASDDTIDTLEQSLPTLIKADYKTYRVQCNHSSDSQ